MAVRTHFTTPLLLSLILLGCLHATTAQETPVENSDPSSLAEDAPGNNDNAQDLYGFGVRLGIYFQALAFLIGFFNVLRLDPKSQFSGVVIAFTVLVRWFTRLRHRNISAAELWVGLALLLLVSCPGMWLLFFALEAQRRKYYRKMLDKRAAFAAVTKGQTINILQALVVFIWTVVANSYFSYWVIARDQAKSYPAGPGTKNVIWLGAYTSVSSPWVKVVMITQASVGTLFTAFPVFIYVLAVAFAMISFWFPREGAANSSPLLNTEDELDKKTRMETKRWAFAFGGALFLFCLLLTLSVELTLKDAGLTPEMNVQRPGQLLPLIAGATSCVSSAADAFSKHIPVHRESSGGSRRRRPDPVEPFSLNASGRQGGNYVQLDEVRGDGYNRNSAATTDTAQSHRRVGSEAYAGEYDDVRFESLPGYESAVGYGNRDSPRSHEMYGYPSRPAYEPYRRLP